jgi:hypothetical protein
VLAACFSWLLILPLPSLLGTALADFLSAFFFGLAYPKVLPLSSVVQSATRGIRGGSLSAFRISTFVLRMAAMAGVDVSLSRRAMAANLSHLSNRHLP